MKRTISFILSLIMVVGIITSVPVTVSAASVDDLTFKLNEDGESYSLTGCENEGIYSIEIPYSYNGLPVTNIGQYAFGGFERLAEISLPESIISIEKNAFAGCPIKYVALPNSLESIGEMAFYECDSLRTVTFGESLKSIGDEAFELCENLMHISLSDYIESIGYMAFAYCKSLTSVEIPDSVTSIGRGAFFCCNNLTSVIIGNGVSSIESSTFNMCEKLSTIVIPDSVTNIGESSFFECPNISDVYYQGTANDWAGVNLNNSNTELSNGRIHFSVTDIESHYYVEVYTEPTCTTEGSGLRKCPCGYESSEAIPMLEHVMVNGVCTSCGIAEIYESSHPYKNDMDETWTIYREGAKSISITFSEDTKTESGCDYIYIYSASELIGEYSGTELAGETITVSGDTIQIRLVSDSSVAYYGFFVENTEVSYSACSHTVTEIRGAYASNCVMSGYTGDVYCLECGDLVARGEVIPSDEDAHVMCTEIKEATCLEGGYTLNYCDFCSYEYKTDITNALGHSYGEWFITSAATCVKEGSKNKTCSVCGDVITETISALGHDYSTEWTIDVAPTCTEKGSKSHHCTICDDKVEITPIPATGIHTPTDWIIDNEAGCNKDGSKHKECTACGIIVDTATIPATGIHTPTDWIIDNEAGTKHKDCTVCGEILETEALPKVIPATPKLTSASRVSNGVKVSWNRVLGSDSYIVYRKTSKSGWTNLGTTTENTFTDTKAKTGTTYYYTVKAQNDAGASGYNKTGLKIKYVAAPKLTSIANEASGVRVKWSKVSGADGYYLYRRVAGSKTWTKVATIKKGSTTSYLDKKASAGKTYEYIIKCYDGSTPSASAAKAIKIKRLTVPKLVSAKSAKAGVTVKWGKVAGAEGYLVYRKTGKGSWVQLTKVEGNAKVSYVDKSAKKGKTYSYTVRAYSGSYKSAYNTKGLTVKDKY